jgi:hypothetical protein
MGGVAALITTSSMLGRLRRDPLPIANAAQSGSVTIPVAVNYAVEGVIARKRTPRAAAHPAGAHPDSPAEEGV